MRIAKGPGDGSMLWLTALVVSMSNALDAALVWLHLGCLYWLASRLPVDVPAPSRSGQCRQCGGELRCVLVINNGGEILYEHALAYLDSG